MYCFFLTFSLVFFVSFSFSKENCFLDGVSLYNRGKEKKALIRFRECLKKGGNNDRIYYYAGVIRYNQKDYIKAIYNFKQSLTYPEKGFNGYFYLGRIFQKQKKYEKAIKEYTEYIKRTQLNSGKQKAKSYIQYCQSRLNRKNKVVSGKKIKKISTQRIKNIKILWRRGFSFFAGPQEKKKQEAYKSLMVTYQQFTDDNVKKTIGLLKNIKYKFSYSPMSQYASANLVSLYFYTENINKALEEGSFFTNAYPKGDLSLFVRLILSKIYIMQNNDLKASIELEQLEENELKDEISSKLIQTLKAFLLSRKEDLKSLLNLKQNLDLETEKNGFVLFEWFKLYRERKQFKESLVYLNKSIESFCKDGKAECFQTKLDLYNLYYSEGKWKLAFNGYIDVLDQNISIQDSVWSLYQIANIFYRQEEYKKAIIYYRRLIDQFPNEYWTKQSKFRLEDAVWRFEHQ